jgi:hypothetical protein
VPHDLGTETKRQATHSPNLERDSGEMGGETKEVSEQPEGSTGILKCPVRRPVDLEIQVLVSVLRDTTPSMMKRPDIRHPRQRDPVRASGASRYQVERKYFSKVQRTFLNHALELGRRSVRGYVLLSWFRDLREAVTG